MQLAGQIVVDKRRAWAGLVMTAFVNRHHTRFIRTFINDDKQTFAYSFNTTHTPYTLGPRHAFGIGRAVVMQNGTEFFCASTMGQRHPHTGEVDQRSRNIFVISHNNCDDLNPRLMRWQVLFLHRNQAKFNWAPQYLDAKPMLPLWTHMGMQACRDRPSHHLFTNTLH